MPPTISVTTTTNQYLAPNWVDLVLRNNYFFGEIMKRTKRWEGSQKLQPFKYQKGVASVAFSGFDLLPITQQPVSVNMVFYPSFVATNVALAGTDLSINQGEEKKLDLMRVTMESRAQDASDDIGNFLQGDGTSFGGKAPMGLSGIVDNGSDLSSYGGFSRATYTGLNATVTASGGTISLLKVRTLWNQIADNTPSTDPDMILTTFDVWAYFEALQTPFQRNNADFNRDTNRVASTSGYKAQIWDGMEISKDKKVPAGLFYMLNTQALAWEALKWYKGNKITPKAKNIKLNVYEDSQYAPGDAFTWTGMVSAYNQATENGWMILGGQLVCIAPFRQGVLTGITGY